MKDKLKLLLQASSHLTREKDLKRNLITLTNLTKELLNADICSIFLHNHDNKELWSIVAYYADEKITIPESNGIVGHVFSTGKIVNIADAYNDPRFDNETDRKTGYKTCTILAVPLINLKGKKLGVVEVINKLDGSSFVQDDIDLLSHIVFYINAIIENT